MYTIINAFTTYTYELCYLIYNLAVSGDSNCCRKCLSLSTVNDVPFAPLIASVGMLEYD